MVVESRIVYFHRALKLCGDSLRGARLYAYDSRRLFYNGHARVSQERGLLDDREETRRTERNEPSRPVSTESAGATQTHTLHVTTQRVSIVFFEVRYEYN